MSDFPPLTTLSFPFDLCPRVFRKDSFDLPDAHTKEYEPQRVYAQNLASKLPCLTRLSWIRTSLTHNPFELSYNIERGEGAGTNVALSFDIDIARLKLTSNERVWGLHEHRFGLNHRHAEESIHPLIPFFLILAVLTASTTSLILNQWSSILIGLSAIICVVAFLITWSMLYSAVRETQSDQHWLIRRMPQRVRDGIIYLYMCTFVGQTAFILHLATADCSCSSLLGISMLKYAVLFYFILVSWPISIVYNFLF
jgi:hypothetical protein